MSDEQKPEKEIRLINESVKESMISDAFTFIMIFGVIGVGALLNSGAMQWIGFLMLILSAFVRSSGLRKTLTPQEGADWLRDEYGVTAEPIKKDAI